ncbi:MAG TPA: prolyl oligopeptidase family serine peptidase [Gemmataceae bacterium]|nr:prolyl oligopeptidase family serine peptidase [Gemmataceae bacterium]
MPRILLSLLAFFLLLAAARADGPGDNDPANVKRIPPPGIKISEADRARLQAGLDLLGKEIDDLRTTLKAKPDLLELLPDVQIFHKSVEWALKYDEFYDPKEVAVATKQLQEGMTRARDLRSGNAPWNTATGLVVRGYKSKIDDSIQPYGLVVPETYSPKYPHKYRLDFWCHGRGEKLTELSFINGRMTSKGEFAPPNAFVLHLYGRYCCANKFAGEVDLFEAYENARKHYPIDENRLVIRGFSMGGAACWQFAVHYPGFFCAAAPGAGFSETADFLKVFQNEKVQPTWYEQKLWHWYDCTDYALNLFNLPTVAYSGEIDRQKQAADMMAKALEKEGMTLTHIIGPKTEHRYEPKAKEEVNRRIDAIAEMGRDRVAKRIRFSTYTLRYNRVAWLQIDGSEEEWSEAWLEGVLHPFVGGINLRAKNVSAFTVIFGPGEFPEGLQTRPAVSINEPNAIEPMNRIPRAGSDRSWTAHFRKVDGKWKVVDSVDDGTLRKRHGLQGPIDDAFMDRFIMVVPTGTPLHEKTGDWVKAEMAHAIDHWRRQFRGEAIVKKDSEITDADIASSNLVLWGDPSSNKILEKIAGKLPLNWDGKVVRLGSQEFSAGQHVPVLIYPNPLNPKKYVVLNSGFTFREYDYLNNARQVPKLPDYAIIDISKPVTSRAPGGIAAAGFFDEEWKLKEKK